MTIGHPNSAGNHYIVFNGIKGQMMRRVVEWSGARMPYTTDDISDVLCSFARRMLSSEINEHSHNVLMIIMGAI